MPHLVLEHSKKVDVSGLLKDLHYKLASFDTISIDSIKSRASLFTDYYVGSGEDYHFINLTVSLMEGRESELLEKILNDMQSELVSFKENSNLAIAVSTKVTEISKERYRTNNIS